MTTSDPTPFPDGIDPEVWEEVDGLHTHCDAMIDGRHFRRREPTPDQWAEHRRLMAEALGDPAPAIGPEALLAAANRAAEAATALADRYANAIADISAALSQGGDAATNRVRLVIASLGEDAADTPEPNPTMPPLPTEPTSVRVTTPNAHGEIDGQWTGHYFTGSGLTLLPHDITSWSPLTTDAETLEKVDVEALREAWRAWREDGSHVMKDTSIDDALGALFARVDEAQGR